MAYSLFVVLLLCAVGHAAKIPPSWATCKRTEPDFSRCVAKAVQNVLPTLDQDAKELGLAIAPIKVDRITLDLGSGPFSLLINTRNVTVTGVDKSKILNMDVDTDKHTITFKGLTPVMRFDFIYSAEGKILVIPVKGDGPAFIELTNATTTGVITAEPIQKKGKTYWNIKDFNFHINPESVRCYFKDLLKGNAAVSEQVNGFLNADWKLFFAQIKVPAEEAFNQVFKSMTRRVFNRIPINDIFRV